VSGHLFTADDRFVKRHGLELRSSWKATTPLLTYTVDAGGLVGKPLDLAFVDASAGIRQIAGAWRAEEDLRVSAEAGSMRHVRAVAQGTIRRGAFRVTGRYQHDQMKGDDAVGIGGVLSSILPRSAIPNRVVDPALPPGTLSARQYDGLRLEVTTPFLPATLFYQRHRAEPVSLSLLGLQVTLKSAANPLLRVPALDLTAGVARVLDEPLRNRTKWWLAMRWTP
jgi:hypothetical protein